ncbi:uncharacterized protein LOC116166876 [Photinus pyralis]|uniref:uncharacterized protein LOC116166876 n=1 Tax=Photinus pyralis TaxID=7054 RepID=UPI0012677045|nr:uncharacterized protein LOC116166876 [Photinus pyralis]
MGLSTASVRHPHVMVMAPALTKTTQSQSFKIPPSSPTTQPTTTLHTNRDVLDVYQSLEGDSCEKTSINELANDNLNTLALVSELLKGNRTTCKDSDIMSSAPLHMGDQKDKMGLRKAGIDIVSAMIKEKTSASDDDQLNNFETGDGTACAEIGQDEFMQVIKCIESNSDKLGASASDLTSETDSVFPLSTDLTSNLTSFEKELLNDVDVMSISIEEQLTDTKETGAKELLANLQKKHTTLQRKLEYTLRRLRKLQAKQIGQHASEEIAGVFEHVHRTMRRKDSPPGAGEISEKLKPISLMSAKNIIKKLEVSTSLQANALGRRHMSRYFGAGSVEPNSFRTGVVGALVVPQWTPEHKLDMQRVTGHLCAEVNLLQNELDSEATLSSSGGESSDEMQPYSNPHQQYLAM